MFADEFKHEVGKFLENQTEKLFIRQREAAADAPYYRRTGRLKDALWNMPSAQGTKITIEYPLHIRFLDMKKSRKGKRKKRYGPIYNKFVYGYMNAGVRRQLNRMVPGIMINAFESTFTE